MWFCTKSSGMREVRYYPPSYSNMREYARDPFDSFVEIEMKLWIFHLWGTMIKLLKLIQIESLNMIIRKKNIILDVWQWQGVWIWQITSLVITMYNKFQTWKVYILVDVKSSPVLSMHYDLFSYQCKHTTFSTWYFT